MAKQQAVEFLKNNLQWASQITGFIRSRTEQLNQGPTLYTEQYTRVYARHKGAHKENSGVTVQSTLPPLTKEIEALEDQQSKLRFREVRNPHGATRN